MDRMEITSVLSTLRVEHARSAALANHLARAIQETERALASHCVVPPTRDGPFSGSRESRPIANTGWAYRLRGLTQYEALIRIAEDGGGVIRTADVPDIFIRAGLAKGKRSNINGHIHKMLTESEEFAHVSRGTFRLVATPGSAEKGTDSQRGERA